jgi:hypothetical protein
LRRRLDGQVVRVVERAGARPNFGEAAPANFRRFDRAAVREDLNKVEPSWGGIEENR